MLGRDFLSSIPLKLSHLSFSRVVIIRRAYCLHLLTNTMYTQKYVNIIQDLKSLIILCVGYNNTHIYTIVVVNDINELNTMKRYTYEF